MSLEVPNALETEMSDHLSRVARVLQLVLLHCPGASNNSADVCRLLLVNSTIQAAVQQSRAYLEVDYGKHLWHHEDQSANLVSFAAWLSKHSGLVNSLHFSSVDEDTLWSAETALILGLHLCAEQAAQLAAGTATSPTGRPYPPPLRLKEFWTDRLVAPVLLQLLPLFHLEELDLNGAHIDTFTPRVCEALGKITTLRSLECETFATDDNPSSEEPASEAFMEAVAQLMQLTMLNLSMNRSALPLLPIGLRKLGFTGYEGSEESRVLDLRHLSNLTCLCCAPQPGTPMTAMVPQQLQDIEAYGALKLSGTLPELTSFKMWTMAAGEPVLPTLTLPRLQQPLSMDISVAHRLPDDELVQIAAELGTMTCLTRLNFQYEMGITDEWSLLQPWCRLLLPLTKLQSLTTALRPTLQHTDLVQLTALTGVTDLCICNTGVNDFVAVALADSLTGLQALCLESEGVQTMAMLHPVSKLTGLKDLRLSRLGEVLSVSVSSDELLHLTTLTGLTRLSLALGNDCTEEVQGDFLSAMPRLT